jgi:hypothetical protein
MRTSALFPPFLNGWIVLLEGGETDLRSKDERKRRGEEKTREIAARLWSAPPPVPLDTQSSGGEPSSRSRRVRWVVILVSFVNAAFLIWLLSGMFMRELRACSRFVGLDRVACESHNGGTPAGIVLSWWRLADVVVLALVFVFWMVARHRGRVPR